jgi:hypothetical protein
MPPRSTTQHPELLATLSLAQENVVSRAQLVQLGYNSDAIRRRIDNERWQECGRAIVLHNAGVSDRQLRWAAILTAPGPAIISGRSGAARYGLRGFQALDIDVLVAINARPVHIDGVAWRRCLNLDRVAIASVNGPPTAAPARCVIDAAGWTRQPRAACGLVAAAVQQRVVPVKLLRREIAPLVEIRHRGILIPILADIEGGADSLSEIDFTVLARKAGLRPPIRQSIRLDSSGPPKGWRDRLGLPSRGRHCPRGPVRRRLRGGCGGRGRLGQSHCWRSGRRSGRRARDRRQASNGCAGGYRACRAGRAPGRRYGSG